MNIQEEKLKCFLRLVFSSHCRSGSNKVPNVSKANDFISNSNGQKRPPPHGCPFLASPALKNPGRACVHSPHSPALPQPERLLAPSHWWHSGELAGFNERVIERETKRETVTMFRVPPPLCVPAFPCVGERVREVCMTL